MKVLVAGLALWAVSSAVMAQVDEKTAQKSANADARARDAALEDAHRALLADQRYQFERPVRERERQRTNNSPGWLRWLSGVLGSIFSFIAPLLRLALWVGLGMILLAVGYFILSEVFHVRLPSFRKRKEKLGDDVYEPQLRPDAAAARSLLEEADALAKAGRYGEAVHLLLFRSIEDLQSRRGGLKQSLTSREIGQLGDIPEKPRRALSPIIQLVERSFFGDRDVDADDWQGARASYEAFAFGEAWT